MLSGDRHSRSPYAEWYATPLGAVAFDRQRELLRNLMAAWPRRSRSLLVMHAGKNNFLSMCWEAGFDVAGQEHDPNLFHWLCQEKSTHLSCFLSAPCHMPVNDDSYDYIVCSTGSVFRHSPLAVLREIRRVASRGCILLFPNLLSCFAIECLLKKKGPCEISFPDVFLNPVTLRAYMLQVFRWFPVVFESTLFGASHFWANTWLAEHCKPMLPLPFGAYIAVRVDFGTPKTGTPLLLPTQ